MNQELHLRAEEHVEAEPNQSVISTAPFPVEIILYV